MANITHLPVTGQIKTGGEKVIALNQQNIDLLKKGYSNDPAVIAANSAVSNKDLLSQSFATPALDVAVEPAVVEAAPAIEVVPTQTETAPVVETAVSNSNEIVENPVQITGIPTVQNTVNLESNPVNMSMEPVAAEENNTMDPLSGLDNLIPNTTLNVTPIAAEIASTENNANPIMESANEAPVIDVTNSEVKKEESAMESPFQVTSAPNIFDQPIAPVEEKKEEVVAEKTDETVDNNVNLDPLNIFAMPQTNANNEVTPTIEVSNEENKEIKTESVANNIELTNDILQAEIALEKEAADLYDKLAQNSRKKIELLEQKRKTTTNNVIELNTNLEPSASELFNSNGTLNDNKVLEEAEGAALKLVA